MSRKAARATAHRLTGSVAVLLTAAIAAAVDLSAKAVSEVRLADSSVDLGLLELRLGYNSGVAFGMGDRLPAWVIVAATASVCVALGVYLCGRARCAGRVEIAASGAVLGGAVANVVDRTRDGVVTDYLHTGWWPTFNLADAFLVVGGIVIVLVRARPQDAVGEDEETPGAHLATTDAGDP